jgi:hypothetical protein
MEMTEQRRNTQQAANRLAASGIIVRYVSWKKKSSIVVIFPFFSSNVTASDGSFWCLMTEIQKLQSSRQVFFEASFEVSSNFLRSFLGKTSDLWESSFFFSKKQKISQKSNKFQNVFLFRTIRKSSKFFEQNVRTFSSNFFELCLKKVRTSNRRSSKK